MGVKAVFRRLARILLPFLLLGLLIWIADPERLLASSLRVDVDHLFGAVLVFLVLLFLEGCRLRLTLGRFGVGLAGAIYLLFAGFFFSNLMPGNLGAEAYRVIYLRGKGYGAAAPAAILAVGKLAGLLAVLLPALAYIFFEWPRFGARLLSLAGDINVTFFFVVLSMLVFFVPTVMLMNSSFRHRLWGSFGRMRHAVRSISLKEAVLLFLISLATQFCRMAMIGLLVHAYGATLEILDLIPVTALVVLSMFIPMGVGGLGVREGALAGALYFFGVPASIGVGVALMNRVFLFLAALVGLLLWSVRRSDLNAMSSKV